MTVPARGHAGSVREWLLLVPIGAYAILGVGGTIVAMGQAGLSELVTVTTPGGQAPLCVPSLVNPARMEHPKPHIGIARE